MYGRRAERALLVLIALAVLVAASTLLLVSVVFVSPQRTSDRISNLPDWARISQGFAALGCFLAAGTSVGASIANLKDGKRAATVGWCLVLAVALGVFWIAFVGRYPS